MPKERNQLNLIDSCAACKKGCIAIYVSGPLILRGES